MLEESLSSSPHRQTIVAAGYTWVDLERPTAAEADALTRDFGLERTDVEAALNRGEPSGVWERPGYAMIVVRVPVFSTGRRARRLAASPVALFASRDYLITVHWGEVRPLVRMFQQCETDERAREAAFAVGISGLTFAVLQRLVDATAAARSRGDRALGTADELGSAGPLPSRADLAEAVRRRADARAMWRMALPLPSVLLSTARLLPIPPGGDEAWRRVASRAERLVESLEDDLATVDGVFIAATAGASLQAARYLRAIVAIAALTLPVVAIALLVGMPIANPLVGQPNGYAIGLALAGIVFLAALLALKRGRYI